MGPLSGNERKILDTMARLGPMTKRDICSRCGMGWATAVKMTTRLEENGYIRLDGSERQKNAGKSSALYSVSSTNPVALGLDVEYGSIRCGIINLKGELLFEQTVSNRQFADVASLTDHLVGIIESSLKQAGTAAENLEGIGMGIPSHMLGRIPVSFEEIARVISARTGLKVLVDNNIRCFTRYVYRFRATANSCLVLTIRTGVGCGIVLGGRVFNGEEGRSGEIGHITVDPEGELCRCGKKGCLETLVNRSRMAERCRTELSFASTSEQECIEHLFTEAAAGRSEARRIIDDMATLLAKAVASALLVTDIHAVVVSGAFGPDGRLFVTGMEQALAGLVYPGLACSIAYQNLETDAYLIGAAHLILEEDVSL